MFTMKGCKQPKFQPSQVPPSVFLHKIPNHVIFFFYFKELQNVYWHGMVYSALFWRNHVQRHVITDNIQISGLHICFRINSFYGDLYLNHSSRLVIYKCWKFYVVFAFIIVEALFS